MTAILVALFATVIASGIAHAAPAHLAAVSDWRAVTPAVPVFFLALVLLPVISTSETLVSCCLTATWLLLSRLQWQLVIYSQRTLT